MEDALILDWHRRLFLYARREGWDIPEAEDIAQHAVTELLSTVRPAWDLRLLYLHATQFLWPRGTENFLRVMRHRYPTKTTVLFEEKTTASTMLAWLTLVEQRVLTRWLMGDIRAKTGATCEADQRRRKRLLQVLQDRADPAPVQEETRIPPLPPIKSAILQA